MIGCITQPESNYRVRRDTAILNVSTGLCCIFRAQQHLVKPEQRIFVQLAQAFPDGTRLALFLRVAGAIVFNRDTCFFCQVGEGIAKLQSLLLMYEGKDITTLIASKTVPVLSLCKYMEGWCSLIVKRAEP